MNDFFLEGSPKLADHLAALRKKERISVQGEGNPVILEDGLEERSLNKGQVGGDSVNWGLPIIPPLSRMVCRSRATPRTGPGSQNPAPTQEHPLHCPLSVNTSSSLSLTHTQTGTNGG